MIIVIAAHPTSMSCNFYLVIGLPLSIKLSASNSILEASFEVKVDYSISQTSHTSELQASRAASSCLSGVDFELIVSGLCVLSSTRKTTSFLASPLAPSDRSICILLQYITRVST